MAQNIFFLKEIVFVFLSCYVLYLQEMLRRKEMNRYEKKKEKQKKNMNRKKK